jgi:hypothetical protein
MHLLSVLMRASSDGLKEDSMKRCLWLLSKKSNAFRVCAGTTADLKELDLPIEEVLEELGHRCREAGVLFHGKAGICKGRGQAASSLVPWALSVNADLMNLLGINTGEK